MAYNQNFPVFADRYRFERVGDDWDRGRSGFTHLVYDLEEKRFGVIKRAETISKKLTAGLKNEVDALKALKGLGVPVVLCDIKHADYESKNYEYIVIEYIDEVRIEEDLDALSVLERAEIITDLFGLLTRAHQKGIVNGDVDLKHLFWRKGKKELVVIDWGNARLGVDPGKKSEFAYDLARAAEIIFSLVTQQGQPPATGSIALPNESGLITGLGTLPFEFYNLCKWAPRTPSDGAQAPYTAKELFEISKDWFDAIQSSKPYKGNRPAVKRYWLIGIPLIGMIFFALLITFKFLGIFNSSISPTSTIITTTQLLPQTNTPTVTGIISTISPTSTFAETATPAETSLPRTYNPIAVFDKVNTIDQCWVDNAIPPAKFYSHTDNGFYDGFYPRKDNDWWGFRVVIEHPVEDVIQVDFSKCLKGNQITAFSLNALITRLEPEREKPEYAVGREFGFFVGNETLVREYTLWIDKNKAMHLRIRQDGQIIYEDTVLIVSANLRYRGSYPRPYNSFPIRIFFDINNQGSDILYMLEGYLEKPISVEEAMNPSQMIRIEGAEQPTIGSVTKIGLVGRGGQTEALIWPLILLGK